MPHPDIDTRSEFFYGLAPENLASVADTWPRSAAAPEAVLQLLAKARREFVGAATSYDNFVGSALTSLQAAELALKLKLGFTVDHRITLGVLVKSPGIEEALTPWQLDWFRKFALHFRNRLAHPRGPMAFTPGFSEPFLRSSHEIVAPLFP